MIKDRLYLPEKRARLFIGVLVAAGAVALFGCGDRDNNEPLTLPTKTTTPGVLGAMKLSQL